MVNITARHMVHGQQHEHIARVRWTNPETNAIGENSRVEMVDWIDSKGGKAFVVAGGKSVAVDVVQATPSYIRTHADGVWTNNLLALPEF